MAYEFVRDERPRDLRGAKWIALMTKTSETKGYSTGGSYPAG
jgi:hypothetical protein